MPSINVDAVKLEQLQKRSQRAVPIQFASMFGSGLEAGSKVIGFQDEMDKRNKAMEFQKVLDAGLDKQVEAWESLDDDGKRKVPDPRTGWNSSRELMVDWYKMLAETVGKQKAITEMDGQNYTDQAKSLYKHGQVDASTYLSATQPSKDAIKPPDPVEKVFMPKFLSELSRLEKEKDGKLGESDYIRLAGEIDPSGQLLAAKSFGTYKDAPRIDYDQEKTQTDRAIALNKDNKDNASTIRYIEELDSLLPGGIDGAEPIPGLNQVQLVFSADEDENLAKLSAKTVAKLKLSEEQQRLIVTMSALFNRFLKRDSGAAVTANEFARKMREFGLNVLQDESAFRKGMQLMRDAIAQDMQQVESGYDEKTKSRIRSQGGKTSVDIPGWKGSKGPATGESGTSKATTETQSFNSQADVAKAMAAGKVKPGDIITLNGKKVRVRKKSNE